jgi:hypothetical protein
MQSSTQRSQSANAGSAIVASAAPAASTVMEVWIENTCMVELLTPAFATEYLTLTHRRGAHAA